MEYSGYNQKIEIGTATLYHADCMEMLKQIPDKFYQLCICDPPYGIGVNGMNMGGRQTVKPDARDWDNVVPPPEYFIELKRVSANQIIWGGNYFELPPTRCFIIWDKGETMYGRGFAECEQAWTSFDKSARMYKKNPVQLDRIHVTQKPVNLYKWTLQNYAKQGDRILDTHGGSMSSVIACIDMGFEIDCYEIDEDYFRAAVKRVEQFNAQGKLF